MIGILGSSLLDVYDCNNFKLKHVSEIKPSHCY